MHLIFLLWISTAGIAKLITAVDFFIFRTAYIYFYDDFIFHNYLLF